MHFATFLSTWDTLLIMVPLVGMMALGMFGMDERLASPRTHVPRRHKFCGLDEDGQPFLSDPDGRPSRRPEGRKWPITLEGNGAAFPGRH